MTFSILLNDVKGQVSQGNLFFGGSFKVASETQQRPSEDIRTVEFTFAPSAGYFITDNLALGLNVALFSGKEDDGFGGDDKYSTIGVGPFARYYKFTSNEKFAFFGELGTLFGTAKFRPDGQNETKSSFFSVYLSPGFSYFFNEHWALDLSLQGISFAGSDPDKDDDNDKTTNITFGLSSFNPTLGFRYYLGN